MKDYLVAKEPGYLFVRVGEAVRKERVRQFLKWGVQRHSMDYWLGILMEEVGEVAKAVIERKEDEVYTELIQVAAVAIAMAEGCTDNETG